MAVTLLVIVLIIVVVVVTKRGGGSSSSEPAPSRTQAVSVPDNSVKLLRSADNGTTFR